MLGAAARRVGSAGRPSSSRGRGRGAQAGSPPCGPGQGPAARARSRDDGPDAQGRPPRVQDAARAEPVRYPQASFPRNRHRARPAAPTGTERRARGPEGRGGAAGSCDSPPPPFESSRWDAVGAGDAVHSAEVQRARKRTSSRKGEGDGRRTGDRGRGRNACPSGRPGLGPPRLPLGPPGATADGGDLALPAAAACGELQGPVCRRAPRRLVAGARGGGGAGGATGGVPGRRERPRSAFCSEDWHSRRGRREVTCWWVEAVPAFPGGATT